MIKTKRRMYREYRTNPMPQTKTSINNYNKLIHIAIQQHKQKKWLETCEEINNTRGKMFYQKINKLSKYKNSNSKNIIEHNGKEYNTAGEQVQLFSVHFAKQYKKTVIDQFDKTTDTMVNNWYRQSFTNNDENRGQNEVEVNQEEYFNILQKQKNTAPGPDSISWLVVKNLDLKIHLFIIKIFEFCLKTQYFPPEWKIGDIIVIPKPNTNTKEMNNYRPITLLPTMGKLFEKIIKGKLLELITDNIPRHQFGFRAQCSTLHPLTILTSNIQTAKLNNQKSAALFLDIKKAFDTVWHRGLLYKLTQLEIPTYLINIIKEFLSERILKVKITNIQSQPFTAEKGLPQGSPLSPVLYNIYCYDIAARMNIDIESKYMLQFADDTTLVAHKKTLTHTIESLQILTDTTLEWLNKWKLELNPKKCELMIFNHRITNSSPFINIGQHQIRPKPIIKYLGLQIDQKLNFKLQTTNCKKKIVTRAQVFRSLTYKNKGISTRTAAKIYKTICRPLLEYGHTVYLNCRQPAKKQLQTGETSALRKITKIRHPRNPLFNPPNTLLYKMLNIEPICDRITRLSENFAKRPHNWEILNDYLQQRNMYTRSKVKYPLYTIREHLEQLQLTSN